MKAVITGSRLLDNEDTQAIVFSTMDWFLYNQEWCVEAVISGAARGPDRFGEQWARKHKIPVDLHYPKWHKYTSETALLKHNQIMGQAGDIAVIFWDGISTGSMHMKSCMEKLGKQVFVFRV